jgi:predicted amidophosphoribosyltransferase
MGNAEQFTDPYIAIYRRVPPAGDGVCEICHRGVPADDTVCLSCRVTTGQVTHPTTKVLPISFYEVPDQYWNILRYYKDHERDEVRDQLGMVLAATIARFTAQHWTCISDMTDGEPTVVTTVPSTRGRDGPHPLTRAVRRSSLLLPLHRDTLARGTAAISHFHASDDAFVSLGDLTGERVLLVEDTFTSGANTQSAASTLRSAGAESVSVVVAGRVIKPRHCADCQRVWEYADAEVFSFDSCCRCR